MYQTVNLHLLPFVLRTLRGLGESSTLSFQFRDCFRVGTSFREKDIQNFIPFPLSSTCRRLVRITLLLGRFVCNQGRKSRPTKNPHAGRPSEGACFLCRPGPSSRCQQLCGHAIKVHLTRSKEYCKVCKRLFIAYKPEHTQEIKPSTISTWIAKTVHYIYDNLPDSSALLYKVGAHEIRGLCYYSWNAL